MKKSNPVSKRKRPINDMRGNLQKYGSVHTKTKSELYEQISTVENLIEILANNITGQRGSQAVPTVILAKEKEDRNSFKALFKTLCGGLLRHCHFKNEGIRDILIELRKDKAQFDPVAEKFVILVFKKLDTKPNKERPFAQVNSGDEKRWDDASPTSLQPGFVKRLKPGSVNTIKSEVGTMPPSFEQSNLAYINFGKTPQRYKQQTQLPANSQQWPQAYSDKFLSNLHSFTFNLNIGPLEQQTHSVLVDWARIVLSLPVVIQASYIINTPLPSLKLSSIPLLSNDQQWIQLAGDVFPNNRYSPPL